MHSWIKTDVLQHKINTQKTKARFSRLLWHPSWKRRGPILISVLHKFLTHLDTYPLTAPDPHGAIRRRKAYCSRLVAAADLRVIISMSCCAAGRYRNDSRRCPVGMATRPADVTPSIDGQASGFIILSGSKLCQKYQSQQNWIDKARGTGSWNVKVRADYIIIRLVFSLREPIENNGQCISMRTSNLITTSIQITFNSYLFWVLVDCNAYP